MTCLALCAAGGDAGWDVGGGQRQAVVGEGRGGERDDAGRGTAGCGAFERREVGVRDSKECQLD